MYTYTYTQHAPHKIFYLFSFQQIRLLRSKEPPTTHKHFAFSPRINFAIAPYQQKFHLVNSQYSIYPISFNQSVLIRRKSKNVFNRLFMWHIIFKAKSVDSNKWCVCLVIRCVYVYTTTVWMHTTLLLPVYTRIWDEMGKVVEMGEWGRVRQVDEEIRLNICMGYMGGFSVDKRSISNIR